MLRTNRWFKTIVVVVLSLALLLQPTAPALAQLSDALGRSPGDNQALLQALMDMSADGVSLEEQAQLQALGLLDADGNIPVTDALTVNGSVMTLDEVMELLYSDSYDPAAIVTVDGYDVTMADLAAMVQLEQELAEIQRLLQEEARTFSPEEQEQVEDLMTQVQNEGVGVYDQAGNLLATLNVPQTQATAETPALMAAPLRNSGKAEPDGLIYVKLDIESPDGDRPYDKNGVYTTSQGSAVDYYAISAGQGQQPIYVKATLVDSNGDPLDYDDVKVRQQGRDITFDIRVMEGSSRLSHNADANEIDDYKDYDNVYQYRLDNSSLLGPSSSVTMTEASVYTNNFLDNYYQFQPAPWIYMADAESLTSPGDRLKNGR